MQDKNTMNRTAGKIAYIYSDQNPRKAEFVGHWALNNEGLAAGQIHLEHNGVQTPETNLCAMSSKGRYNYPSFGRLLPGIEVHDYDGNVIGWRFEYK